MTLNRIEKIIPAVLKSLNNNANGESTINDIGVEADDDMIYAECMIMTIPTTKKVTGEISGVTEEIEIEPAKLVWLNKETSWLAKFGLLR